MRPRLRLTKLKKFIWVFAALTVVYAFYISLATITFSRIDEKKQADAAIILGAATYGDQPSPVFAERINHGIWLYDNGYVHKLIFTGGTGEGKKYSEAAVAKKYAVAHGVPSIDILLEETSRITEENIRNAGQVLVNQGLGEVLIVSDPLHMKRSMMMAEDFGLKAYSSPTPTSMYRSFASRTSFLAREVFFYCGYQLYHLFLEAESVVTNENYEVTDLVAVQEEENEADDLTQEEKTTNDEQKAGIDLLIEGGSGEIARPCDGQYYPF